jgi:uncharacterized protein YggE
MKTKAFILVALTVLLVPRSRAEPEIKGSPTELTRYLSLSTVTGEGEVKVPADRAIITLKVTTDSRSLADAN